MAVEGVGITAAIGHEMIEVADELDGDAESRQARLRAVASFLNSKVSHTATKLRTNPV